jgi:hypothetical protein
MSSRPLEASSRPLDRYQPGVIRVWWLRVWGTPAGMRGARGDAVTVTAAGLMAMAAFWWFPYRAVLVAGAAVTVLGAAALGVVLGRGRVWHEQDVSVCRLWALVKRIPPGWVFADPVTGELLSVERERGWLTLAVTDSPGSGAEAVVTRYLLGKWAAPVPPPLYRHLAGLDDMPLARWSLRQHAQLADFNARTGALEVTAGELAMLRAQVHRALESAVSPTFTFRQPRRPAD